MRIKRQETIVWVVVAIASIAQMALLKYAIEAAQ